LPSSGSAASPARAGGPRHEHGHGERKDEGVGGQRAQHLPGHRDTRGLQHAHALQASPQILDSGSKREAHQRHKRHGKGEEESGEDPGSSDAARARRPADPGRAADQITKERPDGDDRPEHPPERQRLGQKLQADDEEAEDLHGHEAEGAFPEGQSKNREPGGEGSS